MPNKTLTPKKPFIISKFGGTSVSNRACWDNIQHICEAHISNGLKPVIVCSAPSQVSNHLEALIKAAKQHNYQKELEAIQTIYKNLAKALDLDDQNILASELASLAQYCEGIALLEEATARIQAKILSLGELMLTKLGAAFLQKQGLNCEWQDAREWLTTQNERTTSENNYLSAVCDIKTDDQAINKLTNLHADAIITQGFIAQNPQGQTVLLGRGGSDTSAAYFSVLLQAQACEIWTDVPGVYTANPRLIPEARLLKKLGYDEVQEIASVGAKILHPNCVPPLRQANIPLHVRYSAEPKRAGTEVSLESDTDGLQIKSIITRYNIFLVSIESVHMWKQIGFLADVFTVFKGHGFSVDLISTSETNLTVSLDPLANPDQAQAIDDLIAALSPLGTARLIGPCASISLVGKHIRSILHQISELFALFDSQQIHLLSQAANDLNLTFVVNEDQAERLAKKLHVLLIEQNPKSIYLSKSWLEEFGEAPKIVEPWWITKKSALLDVAKHHGPCYVYDEASLDIAAKSLLSCDNLDQVFYAMKANANENILKRFYSHGLNFECVSLEEVNTVFALFPEIDPKRILFTPNFAPRKEYEDALKLGIHLTIDNLYPFLHWPELLANHALFLRVDPGHGSGHHKYVRTGGTDSKFGIPINQLEQLQSITQKNNITIVGLHAHSGSGILQANNWLDLSILLSSLTELFPAVKHIDLGGGLGIAEKPGQQALDLEKVNQSLSQAKQAYPDTQLWMEPGRYLVGNSGVILAHVTQTKQKGDTTFIGIETGMNSLIRPALYGAYHEIINLTRASESKTMMANIVGPICESGDTLGYSRLMPETCEGDVLLIANTGAYGHCMSSHYNKRPPAQEYYLKV